MIRNYLPILIHWVLAILLVPQCQSFCLQMVNEKCISCPQGFYPYGKYCQSCGSNCLQCQDIYSCQKCSPGYYINSRWCDSCREGCRTCEPRYLNLPNCLECFQGYELYKSSDGSKFYCREIVHLWKIFVPMAIGLVIFFSLVIRWAIKSHKQNHLNYLFKLQISEREFLLNKPSTLKFTLSYRQPQSYKDLPHKITISVIQNLTATIHFTTVTQQRYGNTVYRTYGKGTETRKKVLQVDAKTYQIKGEEILNGFQGEIEFIPKLFSIRGCQLGSQYAVEAKVNREDWGKDEAKAAYWVYGNFDTSQAEFQRNKIQVEMKEGIAEINLQKNKHNIDSFQQYQKYYGQSTIKFHNKSNRQLKLSIRQCMTHKASFGWVFPSSFSIDQNKICFYTKDDYIALSTGQISLSNCHMFNFPNLLVSSPFCLEIQVRPTGFFYWLFSVIVSNRYRCEILLKDQGKQQKQLKQFKQE